MAAFATDLVRSLVRSREGPREAVAEATVNSRGPIGPEAESLQSAWNCGRGDVG